MNTDYILCCGSTVDLTKEHLDTRNIPYICFSYSLDGKEYIDDLGQTMPLADFYKAMENGADTRTSQINSNEYIDFFTPFLEDGKDIIYVSLSSGLSGTYQAACLAVEELQGKYPDRKMYMIDSLGASSGYGLLVDKLADMRDEGLDVDTVAEWGKKNAYNMHYWFCSTDLTFFVKGGRVSKAAGWFGTVLKICPILNANFEGKLIPRKKVKGKVKAVEGLADMMMQHATGGADYSDKCFISHSACKQDAQHLADIVKKRFRKIKGDILINDIGTTIGSHTGPGTVALFFWGDKRVD